MKRIAVLFSLLLALTPASAQMTMTGVGGGFGGGAATNNLSVDCNSTTCPTFLATTGTTASVTLTTTQTNELIVVQFVGNTCTPTSIADTSSLTWTARTGQPFTLGSGQLVYYWTAPAAAALTSDVITLTCGAGYSFSAMVAYGVAGYKTSGAFDSGGPQSLTSDPVSITTANQFTMVTGAFAVNTSTPTAGAGYTQIGNTNSDFALFEYKIVNSAGVNSVTLGTGAGASHGGVADAIVSK